LNTSGNPFLQRLEASDNRLTFLDLTLNHELVTLDVSSNQLSSLNLSQNERLFSVSASANRLTSLDITPLIRLRELDVSFNQMPSRQAIAGLNEPRLFSFVFDPQALQGTDISDAFTCANLLAALRREMRIPANAPILLEQARNVTALNLDNRGIENLAGLELFENLEILSVAYNELTQINPALLPQLRELDVTGNGLTTLNVTENIALERLWAADNQLEQLNLSQNAALQTLDVSGNLLSTLWLAGNPNLMQLNASHNLLQNLDITGNPAIRFLDVTRNFMADEDAILRAPGAFFTTYRFHPQNTLDMDVTEHFTDQAFLAAIREALNKSETDPVSALELRTITALDISGRGIESLAGLGFLTNLEWLDASNNRIEQMDISNNIRLEALDVRLNWMENPAAITGLRDTITTVFFFAPQMFSGTNITDRFPDENFLAALREAMGRGPNDPIGSLDAATTETLDLSGRNITDTTGLEYFTSLQSLNLNNNPLQHLDLSRNTMLRNLSVSRTCLEQINLAANIALETLDVSRNHFTALNLQANRNLQNVNATRNFLDNQAAIRMPNPAPTLTFSPQNNRVRTAATCTAAGFDTWTCGNNSAHRLVTNHTNALGHNWVSTVVSPTFTQPGYTRHTCARCDETFTNNPTPALVLTHPPTLALRYNEATSLFADIARRAPDLQWRSSNTSVFSINQNGLITYARLGRGTTIVTATCANGIERVRVEVNVRMLWWQWLIIIFLFGWIWY